METKEICEKIIKKHNGTFLKGKRITSIEYLLGVISSAHAVILDLIYL